MAGHVPSLLTPGQALNIIPNRCNGDTGHVDRPSARIGKYLQCGELVMTLTRMGVSDFEGEREVTNKAELDHALMKRYDSGLNHFCLGFGRSMYPLLFIMVNGELSWLWFGPSSEHPGYTSVGAVPGLDPKGMTRFVSQGPQEECFFNHQVVPFADALRAAEEFFVTGQLPQCVDWYDLDQEIVRERRG